MNQKKWLLAATALLLVGAGGGVATAAATGNRDFRFRRKACCASG
jgi:hypothetical protein